MIQRLILIIGLLLSALFAQDGEKILHPTIGNTKIYVKDSITELNNYQIIPIWNENDKEMLKSFVRTFMRDQELKVLGEATLFEFITNIVNFDGKQPYVFISPVSNEMTYSTPYLKENNVWIDVSKNEFDNSKYVSYWIFYMPSGTDFRIRINAQGTGAEFGFNTLVNEKFKNGNLCNKIYGNIKIVAYGEYFDEPFYEIGQNKIINENRVIEFKSYTDSICVSVGSLIGFRYQYLGVDDNSIKELKLKIIHPPYIDGPQKDETEAILIRKYESAMQDDLIWQFSEKYELISGEWKFQIWDGQNILYSKDFHIFVN